MKIRNSIGDQNRVVDGEESVEKGLFSSSSDWERGSDRRRAHTYLG